MVNAIVDTMEEKRSNEVAASPGAEFTFSSLLSELPLMALDRDGAKHTKRSSFSASMSNTDTS